MICANKDCATDFNARTHNQNIVLMNAAGLPPTRGSWKNIMKRRPLKMEQPDYAKSAQLN